jgi:hypothetical protein
MIRATATFWNANALSNKLIELSHFCVVNEPLFVGVCETKLHPSTPDPVIPGYVSFCKSVSSKSGGLALFVHNSVSVVRRADLDASCPHALWVEFTSNSNPLDNFILGICYRLDSAGDSGYSALLGSLSSALSTKKRVLVFGDFNSHNAVWGSPHPDANGDRLVEFCLENNLFVLNSSLCFGAPTFPRSGSILDLALCSDPDFLHSLLPAPDADLVSDHLPLMCTLAFAADFAPPESHSRWCFESADWESFAELVRLDVRPPRLRSPL